ncbi:hypothetical protein DYB31_007755 [Aphanomyces astaci]|uniref:Uncharacterized protein n=1 Tax=Aphanomyces astaci TaxID=112090 RepID=A0A397FIZ9_APHAT|nr:hypothetical protein DYB31_007755 [Aphanomyces astaci]
MELVVFDPLTAKQRSRVLDFLRRMGYLPGTRADLVDKYLHNLKYDGLPTLSQICWVLMYWRGSKFGYKSSVVQVRAGEYAHVHKPSSVAPSPLQYIFNPRNCFLEAIRQWLALTTLDTGACVPHLRAVLPVLERLVDEDQAVHDDGDDGWFLGAQHPLPARHQAGPNRTLPPHLSRCRLCSNELSNTFKQCLGCTVYDVAPPFVVCVDCSRAPSRFDPRAGIRSSAGHTGSLPRSQAYKERSDVVAVCECPGRTPCAVCEGCDQCSCLCHTMFLTRYRLLRLGNNQNI